jgi:hypothetical protein
MLYDCCSEARTVLVVGCDTSTVGIVIADCLFIINFSSLILLFVIIFGILRIAVENSL